MSIESQFDREVDILEQQLANGEISQKEFQREMSYLRQGLQEYAAECAMDAYNDAMGLY